MLAERFNLFEYRGNWKYPDPLIVQPNMLPNKDGDNINGPSLIKVPDWVKNPLGKYYLYFSHHDGKYIRMAYSNNVEGPYSVHLEGTLKLEDTPGRDHIASPDVHIDNDKQEIIMYYHTPYDDWQYTFKSTSKDGLNFKSENDNLGLFYFRVFKWNNRTFSIAKNKNTSGISYEFIKGKWIEQKTNFITNMRHAAILVENNKVYIFYSVVGEAPESIYCSQVDIDNNWKLINTEVILKPTYNYEGSDIPLRPSSFGSGIGNELRDPCVFVEDDKKYLLYTVAGEAGIAITKLHNTPTDIKKYKIWGMRRCGNHAITEWISNHFNKTLHNNDIIQNKPWLIKTYGKGNLINCCIDSYEDFAPTQIDKNTIILLRDWYNMSASRLVSNRGWKNSCRQDNQHGYIRSCEEVYLQYCKLWEQYPNNFIIYNKWCEDEDYQKEIEERYNWNRVSRLNKLPESGIGDGSSFKKTKLAFDERYLEVIEKYPEEWIQICSNSKINNYSKKIFGIEIN
tara:strand:+ start:180 stop:1706 length:1527 start_codon:yes stop_codon:yes gene_type:complete